MKGKLKSSCKRKSTGRGSESNLSIVQEKEAPDDRKSKLKETGCRITVNLNDLREPCALQEDRV